MTALAQESYDILTLLPTYIENTKDKVSELAQETKVWIFLLISENIIFLLLSCSDVPGFSKVFDRTPKVLLCMYLISLFENPLYEIFHK